MTASNPANSSMSGNEPLMATSTAQRSTATMSTVRISAVTSPVAPPLLPALATSAAALPMESSVQTPPKPAGCPPGLLPRPANVPSGAPITAISHPASNADSVNSAAGPVTTATLPSQTKSEFKVVWSSDVIKRSHELWEEARVIPAPRPDPQLCAKYVRLLEDMIRGNREAERHHKGEFTRTLYVV